MYILIWKFTVLHMPEYTWHNDDGQTLKKNISSLAILTVYRHTILLHFILYAYSTFGPISKGCLPDAVVLLNMHSSSS